MPSPDFLNTLKSEIHLAKDYYKGIEMDDLEKYIEKRKLKSKEFSVSFEKGYESFKIGVLLRQARETVGMTQEELAVKLCTKKSAISRIENHADDIRLSTLKSYLEALGKELIINIQ